jgi:hypothetical protein
MNDQSVLSVTFVSDVACRLFFVIFGISWIAVTVLGVSLGQRELDWSNREWFLAVQSIAGLLLMIAGCLPRSVLRTVPLRWSLALVAICILSGLALAVYGDLVRWWALNPESEHERLKRLAAHASALLILGGCLALAVGRMLLRYRREH